MRTRTRGSLGIASTAFRYARGFAFSAGSTTESATAPLDLRRRAPRSRCGPAVSQYTRRSSGNRRRSATASSASSVRDRTTSPRRARVPAMSPSGTGASSTSPRSKARSAPRADNRRKSHGQVRRCGRRRARGTRTRAGTGPGRSAARPQPPSARTGSLRHANGSADDETVRARRARSSRRRRASATGPRGSRRNAAQRRRDRRRVAAGEASSVRNPSLRGPAAAQSCGRGAGRGIDPQRRRVERARERRLVASARKRGIERPAEVGQGDAHDAWRTARGRRDGRPAAAGPAAGERERDAECRYFRAWKSATQFSANTIATTTVSRVRLRSTMCVPPCEAGVKPMPPSPVSRPECSRINAQSADRE